NRFALEIGLPRGAVAALVEAIDPETGFLELIQGAVNIGDLDDRQVLEGAGSGFGDGVGEAGGAPFGDDDAHRPGGVGGAHDGPEVVGVLDTAGHQVHAFGLGLLAEIVGARRGFLGGVGHDSLVDAPVRNPV